MKTTSTNRPPESDVIEVSIFGPGKGESIAIHLGYRNWIIVDSCVDQIDGTIPVLTYLEGIGVNVETDVRMVLGTHAHDDHIAGIGTVFERCSSAFFVCSQALTSEEFFAAIEADEELNALLRASSYAEYRKVFDVVN